MPSRAHPNDDQRPAKAGKSQLLSKWTRSTPGTEGMQASWDVCDAEALKTLITAVTEHGAAITFGYSRDRGTYMITLLDGNERAKEWVPANADITLAVWALVERST